MVAPAVPLLLLIAAPLLDACAPKSNQARPATETEAALPPGPEGELLRAAAFGDIFRVSELLDAGVDVNARTLDGATALMGALYYRFPRTAELLIARGADVDARSNRGVTALHQAAWEGYARIVAMLLQKGADPNARNKNGETPLMWAQMKGHDDVARLLIASGADINAATDSRATAASLAHSAGNPPRESIPGNAVLGRLAPPAFDFAPNAAAEDEDAEDAHIGFTVCIA
jgi:ankyrin repeat protein